MEMLRKTRAEIHLDHIEHNLREFRATMTKGVKVAAVVKANAYGHDIVKITGLLLDNAVDCIAVATLQEAVQLRRKFTRAPLLVMGYTPDEHLVRAVEMDIAQTVFSLEQCRILSRQAREMGKTAKVHVKIDTGFNRLGYRDHDLALEEILAMAMLDNFEIQGIFSHLALDSPESDERQYQQLLALTDKLEARGVSIPLKHICDSIGAVAYPQYHMDMVRLGALLYGYCSRRTSFQLKPAMTLCTQVAMLKTIGAGEGVSYSHLFKAEKETVIATLPVGYADGLPRNIWKDGYALIHGQPARYAGLPCMDQCMLDVTGLGVSPGDDVTLFGGQGHEELHLNHLSKWCGTNKNELLTRVSPRVPRVYYRDGKVVDIVDYLDS